MSFLCIGIVRTRNRYSMFIKHAPYDQYRLVKFVWWQEQSRKSHQKWYHTQTLLCFYQYIFVTIDYMRCTFGFLIHISTQWFVVFVFLFGIAQRNTCQFSLFSGDCSCVRIYICVQYERPFSNQCRSVSMNTSSKQNTRSRLFNANEIHSTMCSL